MKIGQLAKQAGVSTAAIRYYERVGVLPEPARRPSGYRDYDEDTLDRLRFIQAGQAVGLTLGELRGVIAFRDHDEVPCAHVLDLIQQRSRAGPAHRRAGAHPGPPGRPRPPHPLTGAEGL